MQKKYEDCYYKVNELHVLLYVEKNVIWIVCIY